MHKRLEATLTSPDPTLPSFLNYLDRALSLRDYADPAVPDEERAWRMEAVIEGAQRLWEVMSSEQRVQAARARVHLIGPILSAAREVPGLPVADALDQSPLDTAAVAAMGAYVLHLQAWLIYDPSDAEYARECGLTVAAYYTPSVQEGA